MTSFRYASGSRYLNAEVLELPLDLPDAEPVGERRVDLHRLARDARLLLGGEEAERPHVVEAIDELDDDDPDVLGHGHEHLPDVLRLLLLHRPRAAELRQLRHAVDEARHLTPESLLDVRQGDVGVLGDVVEERGCQGLRVHLELGQLVRHRHGMHDIWLARRPQLALVGAHGQLVGTFQEADVHTRPVSLRLSDDVCDGGRARRRVRCAADALDDRRRRRPEAGQVHGRRIVARVRACSAADAGLSPGSASP